MDSCKNISRSMVVEYITPGIPFAKDEALVIMLAFFCVLGLLGNSLVVYVYARKRNKLSSTVFIIALACNDIVSSAIAMPYTIFVEGLNNRFLGDFSCKLYHFVITCTVPFSVFIIVTIAIDRYFCICRPHSRVLNRTRARNIVIVLFFIAIFIGITTAMFYGVYLDINILKRYNALYETEEVAMNSSMANMTDILVPLERDHRLQNVTEFSKWLKYVITEFYTRACSWESLHHETSVYAGYCFTYETVFSDNLQRIYQTVYSFSFLFCFFIVFALYILIYRSVVLRRARRFAVNNQTKLCVTQKLSVTENKNILNDSPVKSLLMTDIVTQEKYHCGSFATVQHGLVQSQGVQEDDKKIQSDSKEMDRAQTGSRNWSLREKYYLANIRTAVMLFVVTAAFVIAYLPSWLMSFDVIRYNIIIFHVYFSNHIVNPVIYAFMNPTFRRSLQGLTCRNKIRSI